MLLCAACEPPVASWRDQLQAESVCFDVNLLDGLNTESEDELLALFDCLNRFDHLDALGSVRESFTQPSAGEGSVGVNLARFINAPQAADSAGTIRAALTLFQEDRTLVNALLSISLEMIYARPEPQLLAEGFDVNGSLERGVLSPALSLVQPLSESLHQQPTTAAWLGEQLVAPQTLTAVNTAIALSASEHSAIKGPVYRLLPDLGELITLTHSPNNDLNPSGHGDSLRDASRALLNADAISPPLAQLLADPSVRQSLPQTLREHALSGRLQRVPGGVEWLTQVNASGQLIGPGDHSALSAMVQLLARTNRPMRCAVPLGFWSVDVDLGNLALSLLNTIADWQPSTVQSGSDVLGTVLNFGLTDWTITQIASSGACPTLSPEVAQDLQVVDLLSDERMSDLLIITLDLLAQLKYADQNQLPQLANVAEAFSNSGALPATDDLLRDSVNSAFVSDLIALLPVLASPDSYGIHVDGGQPTQLSDLVDLLLWLVQPTGGQTGLQRLGPISQPLVRSDNTWIALENAGELLRAPNAKSARALQLLPRLSASDPDRASLKRLARLLQNEEARTPLLNALASNTLMPAVAAATPIGPEGQPPLAFAGRLVIGGAVEDLLSLIDLTLLSLQEPPQ